MRFFSRQLVHAIIVVFLSVCFFSGAQAAEVPPAAKADPISLALTAVPESSYTNVKGDASKFRALHWTPAGYVGGIKDFSASGKLQDDVLFESEGHAVPEEGNYRGLVSLTKEDLGYVKFDYDQFRKYYANGGGFYRPFPSGFNEFYTDKELALNIGKFGVEVGLTMKNIPTIVLNYDRDFKEGTKSRLTWGSVYDPTGASAALRKITPSWQNIDEITDSFNVKMNDAFQGFEWKANQHWEYTRANNMREDAIRSAESAPVQSHTENLDTFQEPRVNLLTTTLNVDRWFMKEKVYASGGYLFSQVKSRELFSILNVNQDNSPVTSTTATTTNTLPSFSDNLFTSQTWVGSVMTTLMNPLTTIMRVKLNTNHRHSESTMMQEAYIKNTLPDGSDDKNYVSENQEKVIRSGESVSFRYSGIPHVALYNDYDFEQIQSNLHKFRTTGSSPATSSDVYDIKNFEKNNRASGTLGAQIIPWNHVTMTVQGQHRTDESSFDHTIYSIAPSASLVPTWYNGQNVTTDEAAARISWKPCHWFQPSFRYQLSDKSFETKTQPDNDTPVMTAQISNIYTWDLTSMPNDNLLMTASFSFQDGKVITPTRYDATFPLPTFNFDVYTTLFTAEYSLNKDLVLTGTADYTRAANFNDFSSFSMPYGADYHQVDLTLGCRWQVKKDFSLEPKYAWYQYRANEAEVGSFNAQTFFVEAKVKWG